MKVFTTDTAHDLVFVPRFYGTPTSIEFKDEFTGVITTINTFTSSLDAYYTLSFTNTFEESDKGEIKILDGVEVIYRGSYIVTNQTPQDYDITLGKYEYYQ